MADCTDFPTPEDAKRFKNNAGSVDEFITSDSDTFVDQDGGEHITIRGIENNAENLGDAIADSAETLLTEIDTAASTQRDQFDTTFQAQFAYAKIGNISDYVGNSLPEADKLNSYQFPDDSGEWYGPIQSQTFPITIPADPSNDTGWVLVNAVTTEQSIGMHALQAANVDAMIAGVTVGGQTIPLEVGQVWQINGKWKYNGGTDGTIADFDPVGSVLPEDFGVLANLGNNTTNFHNMIASLTEVSGIEKQLRGGTISFGYGDFYFDYINMEGIGGWITEGKSKSKTRLVAIDGYTGVLNNNNERCFFMTNPFWGSDSTPDYSTFSRSSYWQIKDLTIVENSLSNSTDTIGLYISRSTFFNVENFRVSGFNKTVQFVHSWSGSLSGGDIREGYTCNLSIGEQGQLNGIGLTDIDSTSGRTDRPVELLSSNILWGNSIRRVNLNNVYIEGTHTHGIITNGGNNVINLYGCHSEFPGKVFYRNMTNSGVNTLNMTNCQIKECEFTSDTDTQYYEIQTYGTDLAGCTLSGALFQCSGRGVCPASNTKPIKMNYDLNRNARGFDLKINTGQTLKAWNKVVGVDLFDIYGSSTPGAIVNNVLVPYNFAQNKFTIKIEMDTRPEAAAGSDFNDNYVAIFKYDGSKAVGEDLEKITESVSSGSSMQLEFVSFDKDTGILKYKPYKVGTGYLKLGGLVTITGSTSPLP